MGLLDQLFGQRPQPAPLATDAGLAALSPAPDAQPSWIDKLNSLGASLQDIGDGGDRASKLVGPIARGAGATAGPASKASMAQLYKFAQSQGLTGNQLIAATLNPEKLGDALASRYGYHDAPEGSNAAYGNPFDPDGTSGVMHVDKTGINGATPYAIDATGQAIYGAMRPEDYSEKNADAKTALEAAAQPSIIAKNLAQAQRDRYMNVPQNDALTDLGGGATGSVGNGQTLGDRSNNVGNIRPPPQGAWQGQIGVNPQGYAIFDTPQNGQRAADLNLQAYARHGITTPDALVERWASTSPPNEKAAYKARIVAAVGPQFDLTNPATRAAIMPAIAASEGTHLTGVQAQGGGPRVVIPAKGDGQDLAQSLSDDAIQQAAESVVGGGQLPSLGVGKKAAAAKVAILNRVGDIQKSGGIDGYNALTNRASNKANAASLVKNTQLIGVMEPAAQTALATLDKAIDFARRTGAAAPNVPFLSGAIQTGRLNGLHDPNVTAYKNMLETASNEYAKVISGSTGSTGVTDSARNEAHGRLNEGMTLPQLVAARSALATEMAQKTDAMHRQIQATRAALGSAPGRSAPVAAQLIQRSQAVRQNTDPLGLGLR